MHLPPPAVLLSWPLPNYVDPVSRGPAVLIVNIVTISLAFFVTCLRLITRFRVTCTPGLDDFFIVIALVCCISNSLETVYTNKNRSLRLECASPIRWPQRTGDGIDTSMISP